MKKWGVKFINNNNFIIKYYLNTAPLIPYKKNPIKVVHGIIDFGKNVIKLFNNKNSSQNNNRHKDNKKEIASIKISQEMTKSLKEEKRKKGLAKIIGSIATGLLVAATFFPSSSIAKDLNNNPEMENLVKNIGNASKINNMSQKEKMLTTKTIQKHVKINNTLNKKVSIEYQNTDLTKEDKELLNKIIEKYDPEVDKTLVEFFTNIYGKNKKNEIQKKIKNFEKNKIKDEKYIFVGSNENSNILNKNEIINGEEIPGINSCEIRGYFLMNKKIFDELKEKNLLEDYVKYLIIRTKIHEKTHGAGYEFNEKKTHSLDLDNLKEYSMGVIDPYQQTFGENVTVAAEKYYDSKFNQIQRLKILTEITKIFVKNNAINLDQKTPFDISKKPLFEAEIGLKVLLEMEKNGKFNPKNDININDELFKSTFYKVFKNHEKKELLFKYFEKHYDEFKSYAESFIGFEHLNTPEKLKKYIDLIERTRKLSKKELTKEKKIKGIVLNSILDRTAPLPILSEYGSISLNNNKLVSDIVENGSLTIFSKIINLDHEINTVKSQLVGIIYAMKLYPDKFTPEEMAFVKKLYMEDEYSEIGANYSIIEDSLKDGPNMGKYSELIHRQRVGLKSNYNKHLKYILPTMNNYYETLINYQNWNINNSIDNNINQKPIYSKINY